MNDIWYFDPIDLAKFYNAEVDLTSYAAIEHNYKECVNSLSVKYAQSLSSSYTVSASGIRKGKVVEISNLFQFGIINAEGTRLVNQLDGHRTSWVENGVRYLSIYPYIIDFSSTKADIRASMRLNNGTSIFDELEYL